jgi:hypothetical protein
MKNKDPNIGLIALAVAIVILAMAIVQANRYQDYMSSGLKFDTLTKKVLTLDPKNGRLRQY